MKDIIQDRSQLTLVYEFKVLGKAMIGLNVIAVVISLGLLGVLPYLFGISSGSITLLDMVLFLVVVVVTFLVHELIHGLFFWIFGSEKSNIKFGYKMGALYASSPGSFYTKAQFVTIGLAPFVILTAVLAGLWGAGFAGVALVVIAVHTGGCVGDFALVYKTLTTSGATLCEDTPDGMRLYRIGASEDAL